MQLYLPKKVYKYMKPEYFKKIQKDKKIFINHLNNYRQDKHGSEIGDDWEGILNAEVNVDNYQYGSGNQNLEKFIKDTKFINAEGDTGLKLENVDFRTRFNDTNYYNYCVSMKYDYKAIQAFGGKVMVIHDFPKFLMHLDKKLSKKGIRMVTFSPIQYILDRKVSFTEKDKQFTLTQPFLVKEKRYEYQNEFRVVWSYNDNRKIDKPLSIYCPKALKYCTFQ